MPWVCPRARRICMHDARFTLKLTIMRLKDGKEEKKHWKNVCGKQDTISDGGYNYTVWILNVKWIRRLPCDHCFEQQTNFCFFIFFFYLCVIVKRFISENKHVSPFLPQLTFQSLFFFLFGYNDNLFIILVYTFSELNMRLCLT